MHLNKRELLQSRARIERVFTGSPIVRSLEILKIGNLRWKISFVWFVSWKRVKIIILPAFKSCWWVVVHWDYNVSSAPFVSELRLWELNLETWAKRSRSRARQHVQNSNSKNNLLNLGLENVLFYLLFSSRSNASNYKLGNRLQAGWAQTVIYCTFIPVWPEKEGIIQ